MPPFNALLLQEVATGPTTPIENIPALKLEARGYTFAAGDWMQPANDAAAVVPAIIDALHALLVARADALAGCTEGSNEEREFAAITDLSNPMRR